MKDKKNKRMNLKYTEIDHFNKRKSFRIVKNKDNTVSNQSEI